MGVPIAGIILGAAAILSGTAYLLYRWLRDESKVNKKKIESFENKNKKEIRNSEIKIKNIIKEIINKAKEKIEFFYNIAKDDLDEFRKNKELFGKYYIDYENIRHSL